MLRNQLHLDRGLEGVALSGHSPRAHDSSQHHDVTQLPRNHTRPRSSLTHTHDAAAGGGGDDDGRERRRRSHGGRCNARECCCSGNRRCGGRGHLQLQRGHLQAAKRDYERKKEMFGVFTSLPLITNIMIRNWNRNWNFTEVSVCVSIHTCGFPTAESWTLVSIKLCWITIMNIVHLFQNQVTFPVGYICIKIIWFMVHLFVLHWKHHLFMC